MRFFSTLLAASSVVSGVFAGASCMSKSDAKQVANNFATLIRDYSDTLAKEALTVDFHDYSDSVIELINSGCTGPVALGSATFDSRAAFMKGQSSQPAIPFRILKTWNTCDTVIIRWQTSVQAGAPEDVRGVIVMETVPAKAGSKYPYQIETVYSEFNSGAWLVDLGVFTPTCNSTTKA